MRVNKQISLAKAAVLYYKEHHAKSFVLQLHI